MADIYTTDFIKTELRVGITFCTLALQSKNAEKTARNAAHAQKAHDIALHHFRKTLIRQDSAKEIRDLLTQLEASLALLQIDPEHR
jgi:hypothetical protein